MEREEATGSASDKPVRPPQPPQIERKLYFKRSQKIVMPILLLIPLLALFQVFGLKEGRITVHSGHLELNILHPKAVRYQNSTRMEITVRNRSSVTLPSVRVGISRERNLCRVAQGRSGEAGSGPVGHSGK